MTLRKENELRTIGWKGEMTKAQKVATVVAVAGSVAVVWMAALLAQAKSEISNKNQLLEGLYARLEAFERIDDRRSATERTTIVDYQQWAEEQPRFVERQNGKVCEVLRLGTRQYKVTKYYPGEARVFVAEFEYGGPKACDRVQF